MSAFFQFLGFILSSSAFRERFAPIAIAPVAYLGAITCHMINKF